MKRTQLDRLRRFNSVYGESKPKYRPVPSENKMDKAEQLVLDALDGKIGFGYNAVKRVPLDTGRAIRNHIVRLERELMDYTLEDHVVWRLRDLKRELKATEKEHYMYDEVTRKRFINNYNRILKALMLLQAEGAVENYYLSPKGKIRVRFAIAHERLDVKEIALIRVPITKQEMALVEAIAENNDKYKTWDSGIHTADLTFTYRTEMTGTLKAAHGVVPKADEKVTKGSGELDPVVLKERDERYLTHKMNVVNMYYKAEMSKMRDMNTVDCYA